MGPKPDKGGGRSTRNTTDDQAQSHDGDALHNLQTMFEQFIIQQKEQEERYAQKWKSVVQQFSLLQTEIARERQERGGGFSVSSAPVSRAPSPARGLLSVDGRPMTQGLAMSRPSAGLAAHSSNAAAAAAAALAGAAAMMGVQAAAATSDVQSAAAAGLPAAMGGQAAAAAAAAGAQAPPAAAAGGQAAAAGAQAPPAAAAGGQAAAAAAMVQAPAATAGGQAAAAAGPAATTGVQTSAAPSAAAAAGPAAVAGVQAASPAAAAAAGVQAVAASTGPAPAAGRAQAVRTAWLQDPADLEHVHFTGWRGPKMQRLSDDEDIEHFLATFERMATISQCPRTQWALNLVPLLTGKARAAYLAMDIAEAWDYDKVKQAILEKFEIHTETYRQRFRNSSVLPGETPKELFTRLKELFNKWVCPQLHSKEEMGDILVLEQFLRMVNSDVRLWIREHNPSSAKEAVLLAEDFITARKGQRPYQLGGVRETSVARPNRTEGGQDANVGTKTVRPSPDDGKCFYCGEAGHIKINCPRRKAKKAQVAYVPQERKETDSSGWESMTTVKVNGRQLEALVDTGSSQSLISAKCLAQESIHTDKKVVICCIHGDEVAYPTAEVYLEVEGVSYLVTVGVAENLPYQVVLGKDIPGLASMVESEKSCNMAITRSQSKAEAVDSAWNTLPFPVRAGPKSKSQKRIEKFQGTKLKEVDPQPDLDPGVDLAVPADIKHIQRQDVSLQPLFKDLVEDDEGNALGSKFKLIKGILYRHGDEGEQLVLPQGWRQLVMEVGHASGWGGHLGQNKTWERIVDRFHWPNMYVDIVNFCKTCPQCQLTAPGKKSDRAPLVSMPVIDAPFSRVAMDIVGPLERSRKGNRYILVIMDYATKYPEAFPLRNVRARQVANAFLQLVSRVGIPKEVLTDQGSNFTSKLMKQVYKYLGIKGLRTTPYHPQTDGLVERFNKTLKSMLRKFVSETGSDWDEWLPYLLFSYREVPQASTGFSPFELLYGRRVRGPLDVLKEAWEGERPQQRVNVLSYVLKMRDRMQQLTELVNENMQAAQAKQKRWYDTVATDRSFSPGQKVLLLLPTSESSLLAKWQGPFEVLSRAGKVTYTIAMPGRKKEHQTFHVNMLKEWKSREYPVEKLLFARAVGEEEDAEEQYFPVAQPKGSGIDLSHLSKVQQRELKACIPAGVLSETPGQTSLVEHQIQVKSSTPVRLPCYRIPAQLLPKIKQEIDAMREMGVIEPSTSEWSSPVVLVPKKDGTLRFCMDFRKLNSISSFDPYPMPRVDDLIDRLGNAKFLTTLDLSKGYWQVPMAESSKELTAFRTPFGFYQFAYMPFGLQGAPATFQRLMDQVLEGARDYASAYIDDVVIHSHSWEQHLVHVRDVLGRLRRAGLTVNPQKCALAQSEVHYLGYVIGGGAIKPQVGKVSAILETPVPTTKRQVRSFLGMVGWYRRFIPQFSSRAAALIDLTRKSSPNQVQWSDHCAKAFEDLRSCLTRGPILQSPDFTLPFTVQTDASGVGLGAVLLQGDPGEQKPVVFLSRKLFPREQRYSTFEKECLAIKWALDSLKYYLVGKDFILETDHRALQWLDRMKDTNSRVTRWYLSLQPYRFEVRYRAGPENVTADFLSRVFGGEDS